MRLPVLAAALLALTACVPLEPLSEYRPVVDMHRVAPAKFEGDLSQCRNIALQAEAEYKKRQEAEMGRQLVAGLIAGALVGAVAGSGASNQGQYIAAGAATGALAGAGSGDYTEDFVKYGPRRVVDRCMTQRGYSVLSDIGRG